MERLKIVGSAVLKKKCFFSVRQISLETSIAAREVRVILDRLMREGLVQRFDLVPNQGESSPLRGRPKKRVVYQIAFRERLEACISPKLKENTAQDRMWRAIRAKSQADGYFTRTDLIVLAEVSSEIAVWFTKMLRRAGIIQPSRDSGPGVKWRMLRDPGPRRPHISRRR
jgi:DNA-binding Lrp family transcriptional regulator